MIARLSTLSLRCPGPGRAAPRRARLPRSAPSQSGPALTILGSVFQDVFENTRRTVSVRFGLLGLRLPDMRRPFLFGSALLGFMRLPDTREPFLFVLALLGFMKLPDTTGHFPFVSTLLGFMRLPDTRERFLFGFGSFRVHDAARIDENGGSCARMSRA